MAELKEGDLIWQPDQAWLENTNLKAFERWLAEHRGLRFDNYEALWQWSVTELEQFWGALWEYFDIKASVPYERVLGSREMPGADWFPGARLNWAENLLRHEAGGGTALVHLSELRPRAELSWTELGNSARKLATWLREQGVRPGDVVAAYLPNIVEAAIGVIATTSIGAVWSSVSPDFGTRNVVDRFTQLRPKVVLSVDGYRYRGRDFDRRGELQSIIAELDSVEHVIYVPYLNPDDTSAPVANVTLWNDIMQRPSVPAASFQFEQVPFKHPLWILFSSGTTGLPKGIVHCHGGLLIEHLKLITFHKDLRAGDRMFFFTTTGWMMWNFLIDALLVRAEPVLFDGNPAHPCQDELWRIADENEVVFFGTSPTYVQMMQQAGVRPKDHYKLEKLRGIMLAGSPSTPSHMAWFDGAVKENLWVATSTGGTDICSGFCGGCPTLPSYASEMQSRHLGVDLHAFNDAGEKVVNEVGEMVVTSPMPSMPVMLLNDPDFSRYKETYFDDFPGVWRQGDYFRVNERGGCFVLGRSDSTLNRYGVRIGTAEIYRCVEALPEVADSLIMNLDLPGGRFFMPLFVKLKDGLELTDEIRKKICDRLRQEYSPRHVPDEIYQVDAIPMTLSGKKMEVPVRKILMGTPPDQAAKTGVMVDPAALDYFIRFAEEQRDYSLTA